MGKDTEKLQDVLPPPYFTFDKCRCSAFGFTNIMLFYFVYSQCHVLFTVLPYPLQLCRKRIRTYSFESSLSGSVTHRWISW